MRLSSLLVVCLALSAAAQSGPRFDVASVKLLPVWNRRGMPPVPRFTGGPESATPMRAMWRNMQLKTLIVQAYDVRDYQISGPSWLLTIDFLNDPTFDIDVTIPPATSKADFHRMLQRLLEERFALQTHRETSEGLVYALVVAKAGPKMKENRDADLIEPVGEKLPPNGDDGFPAMPLGYTGMFVHVRSGVTTLKYMRTTMASLTYGLSNTVRHPVVDETSLTGKYDFVLEFQNDIGGTTAAVDGVSAPDIFGALTSQLGLKLVAGKGPVEKFVVDRAERIPVEN